MKRRLSIICVFVAALFFINFPMVYGQGMNQNWTQQQLLSPADLAKNLNNPKESHPIIFSVGPMAVIKGSVDIGPGMIKENIVKLKQRLEKIPKGNQIVIYCGCCPFDRCPNVRPAIDLLNQMQFKNFKLLNLPQNIKVDWIDHGYPVSE